jgi:hypothetical protein
LGKADFVKLIPYPKKGEVWYDCEREEVVVIREVIEDLDWVNLDYGNASSTRIEFYWPISPYLKLGKV